MIHTEEDFKYFETLDEAKEEGYTPVKCFNVLQFYTLKGKSDSEILNRVKERAAELRELYEPYQDPNKPLSQATVIARARKQFELPEKENSIELIKENLEPLRYLYYTVYDPNVKRYYIRMFHPYSVDNLYFYRPDLTFSGQDVSVENLRKWVDDGNLHLLFVQKQIEDTTALLTRLWKSEYKTEGKVDYRLYIELLGLSLDLEDYKDYGKSLVGFKTVCNQYDLKIADVWKRIQEKNNKP